MTTMTIIARRQMEDKYLGWYLMSTLDLFGNSEEHWQEYEVPPGKLVQMFGHTESAKHQRLFIGSP